MSESMNNLSQYQLLDQIQREISNGGDLLINDGFMENTNSTLYLYCETVDGKAKTLSDFPGDLKNYIKIAKFSNGLINNLKINYSASTTGDQSVEATPFSVEFFDNPLVLTFINNFNLGTKLNLKIKRFDPLDKESDWTFEMNNISIVNVLWHLHGMRSCRIQGECSDFLFNNKYRFSFKK